MDADAAADQPIILLAIGGDPDAPFVPPRPLPVGSVVVAADSGLDHLVRIGMVADHVVGDLDSVHPGALDRARRAGAAIHRHPADKDATDLDLALDVAVEVADRGGPRRLVVVGPGAGRLDLLLGDALLLASSKLAGLEVSARIGDARLTIVRPGAARRVERSLGHVGEQVSILPVHGSARGVTTTGLRWALLDADLVAGTSRALSNELAVDHATVSVRDGVVLVVQPGTVAGRVPQRVGPYDPTPRLGGAPQSAPPAAPAPGPSTDPSTTSPPEAAT